VALLGASAASRSCASAGLLRLERLLQTLTGRQLILLMAVFVLIGSLERTCGVFGHRALGLADLVGKICCLPSLLLLVATATALGRWSSNITLLRP